MKAQLGASLVVTLIVLGFLLSAWARDPKPITISVRPQVILSDGAFWLTCRVRPDDRNRLLDYGVVNYREHSQRQLDGADAPITFQTLVEHVPCAVGPAYCQVGRLDGSWARAVQDFTVGGCEPTP